MKKQNDKVLLPAEVIEQRRSIIQSRRIIVRFFVKLICIAIGIWAVFTFLFGIATVRGNDMYPMLHDGDLCIYYRIEQNYRPGDIVTFVKDGTRYFSRIIALPGDTVDINKDGQLLINGDVQQEQIYYLTEKNDERVSFPLTIKDGYIFVLSDMRENCTDSRDFGALSLGSVDGKLFTFFRRRGF